MRQIRPGLAAGAGLGLLLWLACSAQAAESAAALAERDQIQRERAAVEARYKQTEADCKTRFAVSGCVADAQAQRREALSSLRLRELTLDDAWRKAEAEENERRLAAKQADALSRAPPVPRAASAPLSPASAVASPSPNERVKSRSRTADDATAAAERVVAQQRRASEAEAHRQQVEQRNAERAARGKKSTPLPVPTAASVAATASEPAR
jgi:hypothetical protein